jgi:hypothetical protein
LIFLPIGAHFSIFHDLNTLVSFIKGAEQYAPDLKIWASPWSPPSWMKWNKQCACRVPWLNTPKEFGKYFQLNCIAVRNFLTFTEALLKSRHPAECSGGDS